VITPNAPAAQHLPEAEVQKRVQSFDARRALLRSNPSLYVSKTRLSVRRLPLFASETALRKLAVQAVRAFEAEVAAGTRQALSADELAVDADAPPPPVPKLRKGKWRERGGPVQQAKVVRAPERTDALTGRARSKGYGFVEMRSHADALRVLRWANNSPGALDALHALWRAELEEMAAKGADDAAKKKAAEALAGADARKKDGTLVVEFSIENVQVVQRRKTRETEARDKVGARLLSREIHTDRQSEQRTQAGTAEAHRPPAHQACKGCGRRRRGGRQAAFVQESEDLGCPPQS
jgi:nucleolar protein 4